MIALALLGGAVIAQILGRERGVPPIDSSGNYEVVGIRVDVAGGSSDAARQGGWREAQRLAWTRLWARINNLPPTSAPRLSDSTLDGIVAGIVVENEQIGPHRYIGQLGVLFDRARTGGLLGGAGGQVLRSAPMLVIPVEWSGGTPVSFEEQGPWQHAWARFRAGSSPIDYVRPSGVDADSLLLNVGQAGRRGRSWWRMLLDQYGAADVIVPTVHLERRWPGGPVVGRFVATHGPDGEEITRFTLSVKRDDALDQLLDDGVRRIDEAYAQALREGRLKPDESLAIEAPTPVDLAPIVEGGGGEGTASMVVQVETMDPSAVAQAEGAFTGLPGVQASIGSLAIGGISSMRVSYSGGLAMLRYLLDQRGWRLDDVAGGMRLRRRTPQDPAIVPPPPLPDPTAHPKPVAKPAPPAVATPAAKPAPALAKAPPAKPPAVKPAAAKPPPAKTTGNKAAAPR
jgi:hypothetical protein